MTTATPLMVEPVLGYPSRAEPGGTYLFTVDLRPVGAWPDPKREEYPFRCMVQAWPLFECETTEAPTIIAHRFGGTYGPARFLLKASQLEAGELERRGRVRITLVGESGMPLATIPSPEIQLTAAGAVRRVTMTSASEQEEQEERGWRLDSPVRALAFGADGQHFFTGSADGRVLEWDAATGAVVRELWRHQGPVHCLRVAGVPERVYSGGADGYVRENGHFLAAVLSLDIWGDERLVGLADTTAFVWRQGQEPEALTGFGDWVRHVVFDGRDWIAATDSVLQYGPGSRPWNFEDNAQLTALIKVPEAHAVYCGLSDGRIERLGRGAPKAIIRPSGESEIRALAASTRRGRVLLISAHADGAIHVWDTAKREDVLVERHEGERIRAIVVSSDGRWILAGTDSGRILRHSLEGLQGSKLRKSVEGGKNRVLWVDDHPDNNVDVHERLEAVGLEFTLASSTEEAFGQLNQRQYAAIISDTVRREGPREGYVLLDRLRQQGDLTPLFFYSPYNARKHKQETAEHGGQGCTDDSQELFVMVTRSVLEGLVSAAELPPAGPRGAREGGKDWILWVDDRPDNNARERKTFEAVGLKFTLSLSTEEAFQQLKQRAYAAIISDMGRREGPREGYVLLDRLRQQGDMTPLFFYASSDAPEHKRETAEHGGQGCTNRAQDLFQMVTRTILENLVLSADDHRSVAGTQNGRDALVDFRAWLNRRQPRNAEAMEAALNEFLDAALAGSPQAELQGGARHFDYLIVSKRRPGEVLAAVQYLRAAEPQPGVPVLSLDDGQFVWHEWKREPVVLGFDRLSSIGDFRLALFALLGRREGMVLCDCAVAVPGADPRLLRWLRHPEGGGFTEQRCLVSSDREERLRFVESRAGRRLYILTGEAAIRDMEFELHQGGILNRFENFEQVLILSADQDHQLVINSPGLLALGGPAQRLVDGLCGLQDPYEGSPVTTSTTLSQHLENDPLTSQTAPPEFIVRVGRHLIGDPESVLRSVRLSVLRLKAKDGSSRLTGFVVANGVVITADYLVKAPVEAIGPDRKFPLLQVKRTRWGVAHCPTPRNAPPPLERAPDAVRVGQIVYLAGFDGDRELRVLEGEVVRDSLRGPFNLELPEDTFAVRFIGAGPYGLKGMGGGPVVNAEGRVVGMMHSGTEEEGLHNCIPVRHLPSAAERAPQRRKPTATRRGKPTNVKAPLPIQFDGPQRAQLRAALLDAFPAPSDMSALLSDRLNKNFFALAPAHISYEEQLTELLTKANAQAWIADLFAAAVDAAPENRKLRTWAVTAGLRPETDGGAYFDRKQLREALISAFTDIQSFNMLLADTGRNWYMFAGERTTLSQGITEVIAQAIVGDWLPDLLKAVETGPARNNPEFRAFIAAHPHLDPTRTARRLRAASEVRRADQQRLGQEPKKASAKKSSRKSKRVTPKLARLK